MSDRDTRARGKTARNRGKYTERLRKTQRGTEGAEQSDVDRNRRTLKTDTGRGKREYWWPGFKHDPRCALP